MAFITIHTNYGLQLLSRAESSGVPINLMHMAVGDGNGNPVAPDPSQTQLVRERFRAPINRVFQSPDDPLRFTAELIIPASTGGFTLREVGVFDADGSLFAVGNLPATYKPSGSEGAYSDAVVRLDFMVSNASTITLQIDPNIVVVTQQWITNNVTAGFLLPGGTNGQVLAKRSNADGDVQWIDPTQANVVVDTVAEKQILAAGQTIVDLSETITYGLAVYIEGVRLTRGSGVDDWQPDETLENRVILGKSYPEGTKIECVNNEPAGSAPAPLERSKNLFDLQDKATSRDNLDVYSKSETYNLARQQAPAGMVASFARTSAPTGWLKANGSAVSRIVYADLFAAIGTTFGAGDGVNTFNLPDLRGEFIRCADDGRGVDAGRIMGSWQNHAFEDHTHSIVTGGQPFPSPNQNSDGIGRLGNKTDPRFRTGGAYTGGDSTYNSGAKVTDTETRPRNVALLACIKF